MSIQRIRKSVLIGSGVLALAAAGLLAGRLSAGAFPERAHSDFAPRIFGRIARALDLTDDQKGQIKTVLKSHAAEIEAQMKASAAARRALHDAVLAQPADEAAIRARAAELGQVHGDGAILFSKVRTEIQPILTPEQRDRIQTFRERMRRHGDAAARSFENFLRSDS